MTNLYISVLRTEIHPALTLHYLIVVMSHFMMDCFEVSLSHLSAHFHTNIRFTVVFCYKVPGRCVALHLNEVNHHFVICEFEFQKLIME